MATTAIILAAGLGKRMKSARPKVLHTLCGRAMIDWVVEAALAAGAGDAIVVVGHGRDEVRAHLAARYGERVRIAVQEEQRGTGHAVACALPALTAEQALVLYGDTPLLRPRDLAALVELRAAHEAELAMLVCRMAKPTGYGRIVRNADGWVQQVVEHRDADEETRAIREVNPGVYAAGSAFLREATAQLDADNDQGELYFTDVIAFAAARGTIADRRVAAATTAGVNDREQLAGAEEVLHRHIARAWREAGATVRTSARIDAEVVLAPDAVIEHGAVLRGRTTVASGARIDVGAVLDDVEVAADAWIKPYSVLTQSFVGERAEIGPFAHLRPESRIEDEARVGNFVETKKVTLHRGAKANHLAYLGDGEIGERANVGAGTIFCNYDGFQKHRTIIGPEAFIGSDSQLVAPVTVGARAYVATGTTVTRDVPDDALAIARVKQENKEGYAPRLRARLKGPSPGASGKRPAGGG